MQGARVGGAHEAVSQQCESDLAHATTAGAPVAADRRASRASLKASTALALGIALFCSGLFIKGLGLPLPLAGPWLSAAYWSPAPRPPAAEPAPAPAQ